MRQNFIILPQQCKTSVSNSKDRVEVNLLIPPILRGMAEGVKSLLDLSIIVCRTSSGTLSPRPLSMVCHSKRQVKANVSCNAILEEGTYMIGKWLNTKVT